MEHALCQPAIYAEGSLSMEKLVVVVKDGMVQEVYGPCPDKYDVEILDLDTTDPDAEQGLWERLQIVQQYLSKIYE